MIDQTRRRSLFWIGFFTALLITVCLFIFYYKDNKNKRLKDIKKQIDDFIKDKLEPIGIKSKKIKRKSTTVTKIKPKKFIIKK